VFGDDKPLKEGWLKKMGHNLQRDWRPRYVVVRNGTLAYYKTYEDYQANQPLSTLELVATLVRPLPGYKGRFEIETATKIYTFQARSELEMHEWTSAISQYIKTSIASIAQVLEVRPGGRRPRNGERQALSGVAAVDARCAWRQGKGGLFRTGEQKQATGMDALATLREDVSNRVCADCGDVGTRRSVRRLGVRPLVAPRR